MFEASLKTDEQLIATDTCYHHEGPLAYIGDIALTNMRLLFVPSNPLDRLAGAGNFQIDIHKIDLVDLRGIDNMVCIHCAGKVYRFSGLGAQRIQYRLERRRRAFSIGTFGQTLEMTSLN